MTYKGSIKKRLTSIIILVVFLTSITGYGVFIYWYMKNQHEKAIQLSQTVGLVLGQDIAKLVLLNDVSAAADLTTELKSFSNLDSMVLYKLDEKAIFQYSKNNESFKVKKLPSKENRVLETYNDNLRLYIDAMYQDTHIGYVQLNFKIDTILDVIKRDFYIFLYIFLFMVFISFFLAQYFAKKFTDPILDVVKFLEKIEVIKNTSKRIKTNQKNEYGQLYDEVNTMLERLQSSHEELKIAAVAFETQSGMIITDKDQNILRVNKAFTKITGYKAKEVIGQTPALLSSGNHDQSFYDNMYKSLQENHFWIGEIINKHKDGKLVNEHLTIQAVLGNNKNVKYFVASFIDITKQKTIEQELFKKEKLLIQQSKMAQMGEMLENIAHQWRQPLSTVTTTASGVRMKKEFDMLDDDYLYESMDAIVDSAQHLSTTIDDFRNFYKDDKSTVEFNIKDSIGKSITLLASKLKNRKINIHLDIDDTKVLGYKNELIQVFMNILNNAKDELELRQIPDKHIFISSVVTNEYLKLTFVDNAGGVDEAIIDKIFDNKFTTKQNHDGTGIGLYMSKLIVEKSEGSIKVYNKDFDFEGFAFKGAAFEVTVPLKLNS